jgi:hypothetical protein
MFKVQAVEIEDYTLTVAADALALALNEFPGTVTQILPCQTQYSRPQGEGSLRDFHYNQRGYLIIGKTR